VSLAVMLGIALAGPNAVSAQQVTLVSSTNDGTAGNDHSSAPSISTDGRFVAFVSGAANLVPGDTNGVADVFVKDRVSGAIARVSVATGGVQGANPNTSAKISGNGRFVLFDSLSALVPEDMNACFPDPPAACPDVYVHDRQTGTTTLASVSSAEVQANVPSYAADISADGRSCW
jgi:Tol biopolymer transport system component